MNSSLHLPSHPPLLNTYPLSAFTLPSTPPPPTSTRPTNNSPPHPQRTRHLPQNLRILQWNAGGLSPSRRAELIAFLSNNQYDLILPQETHLLATKKFQIPGYSTLHTDRTFGRQGPVFSAGHNTGGGVLTLIHSDQTFSPVSVFSLSSKNPHSDYICAKVLFSNHSHLQFLNLYSHPIRSTPSDSRTKTFSPDIFPNSPDTFILGNFNAHHPIWDSLIPPNPPRNDMFCWIASSGLEILNDPTSPTLLYHSTGSRLSPDISLAPASLAPHCEWHALPGLGSDYLPIEIVLPLSPVRHPNTCAPDSTTKRPVGMFTNHILLSIFPLRQHPPGCSLLFPFPSRSCQGLLSPLTALVVPLKPGGRRKRNLQSGNNGGPAPRHTGLKLTTSDT